MDINRDCSAGKGLVVAGMIPTRSLVSRVQRRASNHIPALPLLLHLPLSSPASPLRVHVTILVLVSFFSCQSMEYAKRKLKLWLDCLHLHVIFTPYDNLSSLNVLNYLDRLLFTKKLK